MIDTSNLSYIYERHVYSDTDRWFSLIPVTQMGIDLSSFALRTQGNWREKR
jgi:hypothetical protein